MACRSFYGAEPKPKQAKAGQDYLNISQQLIQPTGSAHSHAMLQFKQVRAELDSPVGTVGI